MARRAEGWKLSPEGTEGIYYVRFRLAGRRYHLSTGESEKGAAARRAAQLYTDAHEGRLAGGSGASSTAPLVDLMTGWLEALESSYTPASIRLYETYARAHWLTRWTRIGQITEGALGDYQRARLAEVARVTVVKERTALRRFGEWAKEQGHLASPLVFPRLPHRATGKRRTDRKERATELDAGDVAAVLAALPAWSKRPGKDGARICLRGFFEFLWETGLRPATAESLVAGVHWRRGSRSLAISADIDKARFGREVPLSARAAQLLEEIGAEEGRPIFGGYDRRAALELAAAASGLEEGKRATLSVYDLRHARITHWIGQGASLDAVAYLAGHRQVTTTAIYTHGTAKAAARVVQVESRAGGWRRQPAGLQRLRRSWDSGQDSGRYSGRGAKNEKRPGEARASILSRILSVCAKEGT